MHRCAKTLGAGIGGEGSATMGPSIAGSVTLGACKTGNGGDSGPSEQHDPRGMKSVLMSLMTGEEIT